MTQEFVLTVTVNQKKVPNSSGAPAVTSPDIVVLTVNGRTGDFINLPALLLPKGLRQRLSYVVTVTVDRLEREVVWVEG